ELHALRLIAKGMACHGGEPPRQLRRAGGLVRSPYALGPTSPGNRQRARKATIEMIGMNRAAAMMPGLLMSCRRFTPSATLDQTEIPTTIQKASAHIWPAALSSGTSMKR